MAKRLQQLNAEEVSLVRRAANRRRFLLTKSEDAMDEMKALSAIEAIDKAGLGEAIEALGAEDPLVSADLVAKSELDESGKTKLKAAIRVLGADLATALLTKTEIIKKACPACKAMNADGAKHCADCGGPMTKPMEKSDVPDGVKALLQKAEEDNRALRERLEKAEADAAKAVAERRRERFIKQAGELKHLPQVVADDFAAVLDKTEAALGEKDYAKVYAVLKSADAVIADGSLFAEFGSNATGEAGNAEAEIQRKAEVLRKADASLSPERARAKIIKTHPELYRRYEAERADTLKKRS